MRSRSNIQSRYSIRRSITSSSSSWHLYKQQRYAVVISLFSFSSFYRLWSIRISPSVAVMMGASPCGRVRNRNDVADNYDGDDGSVSPSPICTHTRREVTMHFHCGASTAHEFSRGQFSSVRFLSILCLSFVLYFLVLIHQWKRISSFSNHIIKTTALSTRSITPNANLTGCRSRSVSKAHTFQPDRFTFFFRLREETRIVSILLYQVYILVAYRWWRQPQKAVYAMAF